MVELVAVEEVDMVIEVILVEVEDMVDDEMDVDLLTDGEVDDTSINFFEAKESVSLNLSVPQKKR